MGADTDREFIVHNDISCSAICLDMLSREFVYIGCTVFYNDYRLPE